MNHYQKLIPEKLDTKYLNILLIKIFQAAC